MDLDSARLVLWVASLEEGGGAVGAELRRKAAQSAPEPGCPCADEGFTAGEAAFVARRAEVIAAGVDAEPPASGSMLRRSGPVLVLVMLLAGFLTKELGPAGTVSLLAFPLLGVMAWNIASYLLLVAVAVIGRRGGGGGPVARWLAGVGREGAGGFGARWARVAGPGRVAGAKAWLHLGAAALAVGAVAAMYWQGLVKDYRASWESTFLDGAGVRAVLSAALAPAVWLPGLGLPDAAGMEALRAPGGEGAAPWIHRFAISAAVVVAVPRLVLAALAVRRSRRLAREVGAAVRAEAPRYFDKLLAEKRGVRSVVRVLPHRIDPDPRERDALRAALHERLPGTPWLEFLEPVGYGEEDEFADRGDDLGGSELVTVLGSFAATPEEESQGRLLRAVRGAVGEGELLLWLDARGYADRFGAGRFGEREEAWRGLAAAAGADLVIDSGGPEGD